MAMPRKGRREIVVGEKTYYYSVKKTYEHGYHDVKMASVTIQAPDGRFYSDKEKHYRITPSHVKALIKKHLSG